MTEPNSTSIIDLLKGLFRPLAWFCIHRSIKIQDAIEALKAAFIEASVDSLKKDSATVNVSRLAVVTGMHRRDVMRIYREGDVRAEPIGLITKIIGQWQHDRRFCGTNGNPLVLGLDGDDCDFNRLVRTMSNDVHPASILFELERVGAVERTPRGLKLLVSGYHGELHPTDGLKMLAQDLQDLIATVDENITKRQAVKNLHVRTRYDNVCIDDLPRVREWLLNEGSKFHKRARDYISKYDLDVNPRKGKKGGGFVVLRSFGRTQQVEK